MFKFLSVILGLFLITSNVSADVCEVNGVDVSNDPTVFSQAIQDSTSCYEASKLAEACAWGSSLDVQTVSIAYGICQTELDSYNADKTTLDLLDTMKDKCNEKYMNMEGTMYRSMMSYCHLSAIQWIMGIAYPEEI